jgi:ATP-dependent DNA helicase RecQ
MEKARSFMERTFGFHRFRPGQEEILETVLEASDALVIMPTGGGKSLCYQVPAFIRPGMTVVISPLIALMKDQVDVLRVLDLPAAAIHSLMGIKEQEETLEKIRTRQIKLLYVAPERLTNKRFLETLRQVTLSMVAVDEAHCISQWGHDFRPDYLRIGQALNTIGRPQTIALTATATERVRSDIIEHLELRAPRLFITGFDRRNLYFEVTPTKGEREKLTLMKDRLTSVQGATIVYTGTRKNVDRIVNKLRRGGLMAEGYHAGLEDDERISVQESFMEGGADLVVATNAFGMGSDRSDMRMIIHHTFPGSLEAYYQESGRAGRDGEPANCLLLYSPQDRRLQEFFIDGRYPPRDVVYEIYGRLRGRPEDLLWLTYREIGMMGEENIPEMAVASCIKILEGAGAVKRLQRYDNLAELYLHKSPQMLIDTLQSRAEVRKKLLHTLEGLYKEEQLSEGIQFLPNELADQSGLSIEALRKCLFQMNAHREVTYIPPFRGRGLRVLKRVEPERLEIDFDALQVQKAYELAKIDQVMSYATIQGCRRSFLLNHFGERVQGDQCGACDLCKIHETNSLPLDGSLADPVTAVKVLSGVARLKGRFGLGMAAKVLTGSRDRMLFQFKLDHLSTYGLLSAFTQSQVQDWIKELIAKGCIVSRRMAVGEKSYPVIELTARGHQVMTGKELLRLSFAVEEEMAATSGFAASQESEKEIFNQLRQLRSNLAKQERLPPYCIFQDRTLREMARILPETPDELLSIAGVGEVTLRKYGRAFLGLLSQLSNKK